MENKDNKDTPAHLSPDSDFYRGLTKREMFAMAAMQGILSNPSRSSVGGNAAKDAVLMADELLKYLES